MWRENQIGRIPQWRIGRQRLRFENIERRRGHVPNRNASASAVFIDETAARAIDHPDAALCFASRAASSK